MDWTTKHNNTAYNKLSGFLYALNVISLKRFRKTIRNATD